MLFTTLVESGGGEEGEGKGIDPGRRRLEGKGIDPGRRRMEGRTEPGERIKDAIHRSRHLLEPTLLEILRGAAKWTL